MQAVILAGGLATRLGARAAQVPKSLLVVAGRPFIDWQLARLVASGVDEVVLCIGHLGREIRAHVGDGTAAGLRVRWSEDGPGQLGTAGALRRALPELAPTFVVTYGDSYLPFDYGSLLRDLEQHPEASGTMSVYRNAHRGEASNTAIAGDRVLRYAKGSDDPTLDHLDYGATALRRAVIEGLPAGAVRGLDAVQAELAATGRLRAFVATERYHEIGSEAGLAELEEWLGRTS